MLKSSLTFFEQHQISPAEAAQIVPPTTGDIRASVTCIFCYFQIDSDFQFRENQPKKTTQKDYATALKPLWFRCQLKFPLERTALLIIIT